ncbi:MAG: hypothetical protein CFE29_28280 [Bradyrhizobiaceae bacterium PARB1]|nr:MAG: hypothetical protein CFE29_28280 [Bradyrhizobiaceae bacterium PARB1]
MEIVVFEGYLRIRASYLAMEAQQTLGFNVPLLFVNLATVRGILPSHFHLDDRGAIPRPLTMTATST